MFWSATYMLKSPKISTFSYFDEVNPINHLTPWGGFQYNICGDCRNNLVSTCHYAGWIRYKCLFFYECPRLKFWKFEKYIFGHKISQKVIFYVETWSRDQFLGFTFLFFFPRAHKVQLFHEMYFWSNIRESFKIYILNSSNLWKNFEEHFSKHFMYHIFQIIILKNMFLLSDSMETNAYK